MGEHSVLLQLGTVICVVELSSVVASIMLFMSANVGLESPGAIKSLPASSGVPM